MSAPVLAFSDRTRREPHNLPDVIRALRQLAPREYQRVTRLILALAQAEPERHRERRQRLAACRAARAQAAGNIGKPVITIDHDDREGA